MTEHEDVVSRLSAAAAERGDATGWFDEVYVAAGGDPTRVPWADQEPNRWLVEWLDRERPEAGGRPAAVVGCGLGDDAEELAGRGFDVTGFDISPTAIDWARRRFQSSRVAYRVADLFALPEDLPGRFAFVFEAFTLQPLPEDVRRDGVGAVASLVAPGGSLLVVTRGREPGQALAPDPPWPLSRDELAGFERAGLREVSFEDFMDGDIWRFRVHYRRPPA